MDGLKYTIIDTLTEDTSIDTATTITPGAEADTVVVYADIQNVRMTVCGTTPTATRGERVLAGGKQSVGMGSNVVIKVISETAGAKINWFSYRETKQTDL